jgi:hypothetical protein
VALYVLVLAVLGPLLASWSDTFARALPVGMFPIRDGGSVDSRA